eukprot:2659544-Amphidinium_carterae.1
MLFVWLVQSVAIEPPCNEKQTVPVETRATIHGTERSEPTPLAMSSLNVCSHIGVQNNTNHN